MSDFKLSDLNPISKVVDTIAGLATKYFPSEQDREKFKADIYAQTASLQLEHDKLMQQAEEELTKRQVADMASDSWLSKNIRPGMLVLLTVMMIFEAFAAWLGKPFPREVWDATWQGWLAFAGIYGTMRGFEKITTIKNR